MCTSFVAPIYAGGGVAMGERVEKREILLVI
jgi:hypothetical protein